MGGIHDVAPLYYNATAGSIPNNLNGPAYATGWFIGAGVKLNSPLGPGDYFSAQVNYAHGATGYADDGATNGGTVSTGGAGGYYSNLTASSFGFGVISDGVYGTGAAGTSSSVDLTTVWGVNAAYEHFWNKRWQTSIYGAYISTSYNSTANGELCVLQTGSATTAGCDNNWHYWNVGTRTQFNVNSQTYIGLDVIYTNLQTANGGLLTTVTGVQGQANGAARPIGDQSAWMAEFRFHRNFYP